MDNNFNGKLKFIGSLELKTPMLIGSGEDEITDNDIIKDSEGKPYIPATSFIGVLRSEFIERGMKDKIDKLFGFSKDDKGFQSPFYCKDLELTEADFKITGRDGVKINNKTGIAVDRAKYDYEILEPGKTFSFEMGFDVEKKDSNNNKTYRLEYDDAVKFINGIYTLLYNEGISVGAKTQNGLGKLKLKDNSAKIHAYDFNNAEHIKQWLDNGNDVDEIPLTLDNNFKSKYNFELSGNFAIKNSLIVRSYRTNSKVTDAEHIKSNGKPVLPGSSIKGALRARAEKILNTIKPEITDQSINILFGIAGKGEDKSKSRILFEEVDITDTQRAVQSRVKIDRFTGGAIDGALFDSMPEFPTNNEPNIVLKIKIKDCEDHEAGLMLLVLKDLMTADLPIGGEKNIGRGVLKGRNADLIYKGKSFTFSENGPDDSIRGQLQYYVDSLWEVEPVQNRGGKR